jgi:hypothetical protein
LVKEIGRKNVVPKFFLMQRVQVRQWENAVILQRVLVRQLENAEIMQNDR